MYLFKIRVLAQEDIQQIVDYYEEKAPTATNRFLVILYAEFNIIKNNPKLFPKKYKSTRVRFLKSFPYGIHYILKGKTIEILAVLHTSRNPKIWDTR